MRSIGNNIKFNYKHSRKIDKKGEFKSNNKKNEVFEFNKLDTLKYRLVVFKNEKRKKVIIDAVLDLEASEFDYINFRIDHIITREAEEGLNRLLNSRNNFIIKKIEYKYNSKVSIVSSLDVIQKVNLNLVIPKILKDPQNWYDFE